MYFLQERRLMAVLHAMAVCNYLVQNCKLRLRDPLGI